MSNLFRAWMAPKLLAVLMVPFLLCSGANGQTKSLGNVSEESLRRVFVTECMGPRADAKTMAFCNCSFANLLARYGLKNFLQQDAIVRSSSSRDLSTLANLAWSPELNMCRAK